VFEEAGEVGATEADAAGEFGEDGGVVVFCFEEAADAADEVFAGGKEGVGAAAFAGPVALGEGGGGAGEEEGVFAAGGPRFAGGAAEDAGGFDAVAEEAVVGGVAGGDGLPHGFGADVVHGAPRGLFLVIAYHIAAAFSSRFVLCYSFAAVLREDLPVGRQKKKEKVFWLRWRI
jgi:hypothetical protein